ncbi:carbohydrate ABC transporter permease [Peterkaempfera bronchialis]|uniref:Sugar ABC transporter permease n=1 Tax=Peterkaempfera bronchialis TaxID=2126346 RepID=A0A345T1L7_9ACTN|nr:sugar ABC transporter permease [Peterkaempfera bronchialis]AXI79872.1 sugar ABC transporter permease [Peterkaempfera bronchialis]
MNPRRRRAWLGYRFASGFLALPLGVYAVFAVSPFVQTFALAFTDWSGLTPGMHFTGTANLRRLVHDELFWTALGHSTVLLLVLPLVTLALGLFFAFMVNAGGRRGAAVAGVRGSGLYKVVYFFPQMLSISIVAVLWQSVYNPVGGALNAGLGAVGLGALQQTWLGDPGLALGCVTAVMVWSNVGFHVVLFSAAMASIPAEIHEAALLDGAGRAATFFRITLPLLRDTVRTGWVYLGIIALDAFAVVQIMTVGPGGPDYSTEVLGRYLYKKAFDEGQAGYAGTLGLALLLVTMVFAAAVLGLGRRRERIEY